MADDSVYQWSVASRQSLGPTGRLCLTAQTATNVKVTDVVAEWDEAWALGPVSASVKVSASKWV